MGIDDLLEALIDKEQFEKQVPKLVFSEAVEEEISTIINYLTKDEFINFLKFTKDKKIYKDGADFFLRARSIKDFRFGKGELIGKNSYRLNEDITGENGAVCTCYQEFELVNILEEHLNLKDFRVFSLDNQNLHSDIIVNNSDIVVWGKIS